MYDRHVQRWSDRLGAKSVLVLRSGEDEVVNTRKIFRHVGLSMAGYRMPKKKNHKDPIRCVGMVRLDSVLVAASLCSYYAIMLQTPWRGLQFCRLESILYFSEPGQLLMLSEYFGASPRRLARSTGWIEHANAMEGIQQLYREHNSKLADILQEDWPLAWNEARNATQLREQVSLLQAAGQWKRQTKELQ